ncbi:type II toxin-antitoxin system RelE/ParE family toxin [Thalassospira sp. HF15]|uniref:type II toxin-antitoxin system RelE family toxin n=1 Tax=Thalassospira sp. HF15 TaxID=2722755 RepID=UPI001430FC9A|nr:type II toxin-antitoxin system RelE/ParE family toxin [Thalassospira sp. HF15]NIY74069.1 type II toxin-antitoxin system RelE/ParE family toxin [Thalassospira sp. HF15]
MLQIVYARDARKALRKIPKKTRDSILQKIDLIAQNPLRTDLDIKPLRSVSAHRLRVGQYRVIYTQDGVILDVLKIGPRGDIYDKL